MPAIAPLTGAGAGIRVRFMFLPGTSSRIIDLPGGGTAIATLLGCKL